MGILSRLFGGSNTKVIAPGRGWTLPVVGEAHYQPALQRQYRKHGGTEHDVKVTATLVPEEGNAFDANAVMVQVGGQHVGYLLRQAALEYRAALGTANAQCSAKIVGGFVLEDGSSAHFGVKLNASWPPRFK